MVDIFDQAADLAGTAQDEFSKTAGKIGSKLQGMLPGTPESEVGKTIRSGNAPKNGEPQRKSSATQSAWVDETETTDWRVRLSIPPNMQALMGGNDSGDSPPRKIVNPAGGQMAPGGSQRQGASEEVQPRGILDPLIDTNGMIFPYTPNVYITYSANYDNLQPTHSNYPFPVYQNSAVDQFTITGEFTVQNAREGQYWIAANQYLRTVTKMEYGSASANTGAPPPIVKLNGYGDFVFKDVPVVVVSFNVELSDSVDYIKVPVGDNGSWAPTRSTVTVTLQPAYSRASVNEFSLQKFAQGGYLNEGPGFI